MGYDTWLNNNVIWKLLRRINLFLKGGVKLQHKLTIPLGRWVGQCSHISGSEYAFRGPDEQLGRNPADAEEDAFRVFDVMFV